MADNKYGTPEDFKMIAIAAIASTDVQAGMTEDNWQRAVVRRAATIQRMRFLQEGSLLMNVLGSIRIKATIKTVEYEESSTRYIITYLATNSTNEEVETIRTNRTDGWYGRILAQDIEKLKACAGTDKQVIIFKNNEIPTEEQKEAARKAGQRIPAQGYRQAVWFDFLD